MYARRFDLFGITLSSWDLTFLVGAILGYWVLKAAFRIEPGAKPPRWLMLRYLFTVYLAVLAAQLFAYAFDLKTKFFVPSNRFWLEYYFSPVAGPKTLYGAVLALPLLAAAVSVPWRDLGYREALDRWTPALMTVLGVARIGCFLQGCCYGKQSDVFGFAMPRPSVVYWRHFHDGLLGVGSQWSLPVLPTQAASSVVILSLALWSYARLRSGRRGVFVPTIFAYSVFRFLVEFARDDPSRNMYGVLSTSQWVAAGLVAAILVGGLIMKTVARRGRTRPSCASPA